MADEQDVEPLPHQTLGLAVHFRDERARRIDEIQAARDRAVRHRLRHAVRREDHRPAVGNLVQLLDEDRALAPQFVDDELVVHDLVANIDRRAEALDCQLDDADRPVDAGAKTARRRDQQVKLRQGDGSGGHRPRSYAIAWGRVTLMIARAFPHSP